MKRAGILVCAMVAACASGQDLSKPITYRTVAIPLHVALEEMSKQAAVALTVEEDLANEPIILSLKGATTKDVMDRIASTVGAEWQKRSDKEFLLRRTDEIEKRLIKESVDRREAEIKAAIARLSKQFEASESAEDYATKTANALSAGLKIIESKGDTSTYNSLESRYPGSRALVRLLRTIPPRMLAEVQPGSTVVFSTLANSRQRQLPETSQAVINEFLREHNLFADAFAKAHPGSLPERFSKRLAKKVTPIAEQPKKMLLIVHGPRFYNDAAYLNLAIVGADGSAVGYGRETLSGVDSDRQYADNQALLAKSANLPEIPLSAESTIVAEAAAAGLKRAGNPPPLTAKQKALILNPDEHDPLSFLVSDGFLALAESEKSNLVAYPADGLVMLNFQLAEDGSYKLPRFLSALPQYGMLVETKDGWTTASPSEMIDTWMRRTDRHLLGECLREVGSQGYASIPTVAKLALSERSDQDADLPWTYSLFGRKYLPCLNHNKKTLEFYSSLSASHIEVLEQGGKLSPGMLTKEQAMRLDRVAYLGGGEIVTPVMDEYGDFGEYLLGYQPTEQLPEGVPIDATVSMKAISTPVLFGTYKYESGFTYEDELTVEEIARSIATKQTGVKDVWQIEVQTVSPGSARGLTFDYDLSPNYKKRGRLREVVQGNEKWSLDTLPPDLKKKLDAAIVAARAEIDKKASEPKPEPIVTPPQ